ncbi:MAG: autotransporter-associated beta strand repeat-containing protein, partial [Planctomycetota bacterium]|nr:autotransporter-associated beta strand repeat-containing protein [Planctomycetota bacterium]
VIKSVISDGNGESGKLIKIGPGVLTLTNDKNTYTGKTTIGGGTLSISSDGNLGSAPGAATPGHLVIDNATLKITRSDLLTNEFTIHQNRGIALGPKGATVDVQEKWLVVYAGVVADVVVDNVSEAGSLTKIGGGVLMLNGTYTYTGTTYVRAGTLLINGKYSNPKDPGDFEVGPESSSGTGQAVFATLGGVGTINGFVHVRAGGAINPGSTQTTWVDSTLKTAPAKDKDGKVTEEFEFAPGMLTTGRITFDVGSTFVCDFNGPDQGGKQENKDALTVWKGSSPHSSMLDPHLPPIAPTDYDQLRFTGALTLSSPHFEPVPHFDPKPWEKQFTFLFPEGGGASIVDGSRLLENSISISDYVYVFRVKGGAISFESNNFAPLPALAEIAKPPAFTAAKAMQSAELQVLRTIPSPPPPPMASAVAGGEVVAEAERLIEVYVVMPKDDLGNMPDEKNPVLKLPISKLGELRSVLDELPDDHYRIYLSIGHGKEGDRDKFLVRDVYLREGKPIEREETESEAASSFSGDDGKASPDHAQPEMQENPPPETIENPTQSGSKPELTPTAPANSGVRVPMLRSSGQTDPALSPNQELGDGQLVGGVLLPTGVVAGSAAGAWPARLDEAVEKHSRRLLARLYRRGGNSR